MCIFQNVSQIHGYRYNDSYIPYIHFFALTAHMIAFLGIWGDIRLISQVPNLYELDFYIETCCALKFIRWESKYKKKDWMSNLHWFSYDNQMCTCVDFIMIFLGPLNWQLALEESLSITTGRCDLAIATHARKMHKKISIWLSIGVF